MTISPMAVILLALGCFLLVFSNNKRGALLYFALEGLVLSELFFDIGYFLIIGGTRIRYSEFFLVLLFISALCQKKKHINRPLLTTGFITLLSIGISYLGLLFSKSNEVSTISSSSLVNWDDHILYGVQLVPLAIQRASLFKIAKFVIAIISLSLLTGTSSGKWKIISFRNKLPKWYCFLYAYLLIETIFVYILKSNGLRDVTLSLFGNKQNFATYDYYSGRLYGLFSEPSTLAFTLFIDALIIISKEKRHFNTKEAIIHAVCIASFLFLSLSFSSLLYLAILYIVLVVTLFKKKGTLFTKICVFLMPLIVLALLTTNAGSYFANRFNSSINVLENLNNPSSLSHTSEAVRLYSVYYLFDMFTRHPIFGVGFDTTYAYSGLVTSLATVGIFGTVAIILLYIAFYRSFNKHVSVLGCSIFLLCFMLAGQIGSLLLYYPSTCIIFFAIQSICTKGDCVFSKARKYNNFNLPSTTNSLGTNNR